MVDYKKVLKFVEIMYNSYLGGADDPDHPIIIIDRAGEKRRFGLALEAAESLSIVSQNWSPELIAQNDIMLRCAGAHTLTEIRLQNHRKILVIKKRGKIRSEREYHEVKIYRDSLTLDHPDLELIESLIDNFENQMYSGTESK